MGGTLRNHTSVIRAVNLHPLDYGGGAQIREEGSDSPFLFHALQLGPGPGASVYFLGLLCFALPAKQLDSRGL